MHLQYDNATGSHINSAHQLLHQHTTDRQKDMFEFEIKHLQNRTLK